LQELQKCAFLAWKTYKNVPKLLEKVCKNVPKLLDKVCKNVP
jgi:hypothetical protein